MRSPPFEWGAAVKPGLLGTRHSPSTLDGGLYVGYQLTQRGVVREPTSSGSQPSIARLELWLVALRISTARDPATAGYRNRLHFVYSLVLKFQWKRDPPNLPRPWRLELKFGGEGGSRFH